MFVGKYNKSVILTYVGVCVAVAGMVFAFRAKTSIALLCLVVSGVCDMFDGTVARKCKRDEEEKAFGIEIDSLADMVGFAILPVTIMIGMGWTAIWQIVIYCLYVLAAITRLGFYNITVEKKGSDGPVSHYSGLPVTGSAIIFPILWMLHKVMNAEFFMNFFSIVMLLVAFAFVFNMKIPKFKLKLSIILAILAIGLCVVLYLF